MTPAEIALIVVLLEDGVSGAGNCTGDGCVTKEALPIGDEQQVTGTTESSTGGGWSVPLAPPGYVYIPPDRYPFPASNRTDYAASPDVGSGGSRRGGHTYPVHLGLYSVAVRPLTMSESGSYGGVTFVPPVGSPAGADFSIWVSIEPDGEAIAGCSGRGGFDGKLRIDTRPDSPGCVLQMGTTYYLNLAACFTSTRDYACRDNAETAWNDGSVLISGTWQYY